MKWIFYKAKLLIFFVIVPGLLSFTSDNTVFNADKKYVPHYTEDFSNIEKQKTLDLYNSITAYETYKKKRESYQVTITMYEPLEGQTDDSPNITADGTWFEIEEASKYRYVALSRNILSKWGGSIKYGDFVEITNAGEKSGIYQVRDTMHPRFINYVDILETPGSDLYKYKNAQLRKYQPK